MTTLYCHPWIGEFGWELCWWNPLARYHAKQYDHTIVAAPEGSRYLYEFADTFIPLQTNGITFCKGELKGDPPVVSADFFLKPEKEFNRHTNDLDRTLTKRIWRSLAPNHPVHQADILCAFRPPKYFEKRRVAGKEYPLVKCQQLVDLLIDQNLSVACFGGLDNYCPRGAKDLRGQPLEEQCSAIAIAKCVVGPSSGPIHLASLCECPHVTWLASTHPTLNKRYVSSWNPFNVPVRFLKEYPPSPETVTSVVMELLCE